MNKPERSLESYKARHLEAHRLDADETINTDQPGRDSANSSHSPKPGITLRRWAAALISFATLIVTTVFISQTFKNTSETAIYQALHTPWGLFTQNPPINRPSYVMDFDDGRGLLRWVSFKVQLDDLEPGTKRPDIEKNADPWIDLKYQGARRLSESSSEYQCAGLISRDLVKNDLDTLRSINFYSVHAPQTTNLNRSLMRQLKNHAKKKAEQGHQVWVILGPIYSDNIHSIGPLKLPSHYFGIIVTPSPPDEPLKEVFILPQLGTEKDLSLLGQTLEEVERASGLDLSALASWNPQ